MMVTWMIVCRYDFKDQIELRAFACVIFYVYIDKHCLKNYYLIVNLLIVSSRSVPDVVKEGRYWKEGAEKWLYHDYFDVW